MATGHLRKRIGKNGAVSYQLTAEGERDPITGKRERRYKTVNGTKKQAEAALRKMIADLEDGSITTASSMKLADWLQKWVQNYLPRIEETTRVSYEEKIKNYITPVLGNVPVKALKPDSIQMLFNDMLKNGLSPKTIRNTYNILNPALKKAVALRMIPYNPCEGIELPKLIKFESEVYDTGDIQKAIAVAKGTDMHLPVLLALIVGLRRGELLALRWDHVDFETGIIHIRENMVKGHSGKTITKPPKSRSGIRDIPVGAATLAALAAAKAEYDHSKTVPGFQDNNFVVCQTNGKPYQPDSITRKWERFMKAKELPHVRLHDLRHSCATALVSAGVDSETVRQTLGHSDISITMKYYVKSTPTMKKNAAEAMDKMLIP